jgi:hypothetical protein
MNHVRGHSTTIRTTSLGDDKGLRQLAANDDDPLPVPLHHWRLRRHL